MANENDIGGRVGLDITDFKANINQLSQQIKLIDTGFKAAAAGMDDWGNSEEGLQKRIESLNQITDLQRQKVENLRAIYERVAEEKGENSRAAQELLIRINRETEALNRNEAELRRTRNALDNFGEEADQAADDADQLTRSTEEATEELKKIGGNAAKAAATGIAAVSAAAVAAVASLAAFADGSDKAMNKFQAATGASVEEMEGFRDIANELYTSNLGDSFEDVAASMAQVEQVTKLTGQALSDVTKNALIMRDTFGYDVKESINTVNSLVAAFGISTDEAYTLIAQGAQMGADKNGDLIDVMNEYAPHFAQLGMSADEFTDTLIQGAVSGAFQIDKVGDAVKEFGIRAKDESKASAEAFEALGLDADKMFKSFSAGGPEAEKSFQLVIQKLSDMEDPLAQNRAGVALFGTMFEDLGATAIAQLADIDDNADMTRDTLQKINELQYSDVESALEGLKRQLITSVAEPIGQAVLPAIQSLIEKAKDINIQPIIDGFKWVIDNAGNIAAGAAAIGAAMLTWNVVTTIQSVVTAIKAWRTATQGMTIAQAALNLVMSLNPIGLIVTAVAALVAGLIVLWNTNDGFRNAVIGAWEAIKAAGVAVWEWLVKFFAEDIPAAFNGMITAFSELPGKIAGFFNNIIDHVRQWGENAVDWVKTEVPKIIDNIITFFNELPGKIGYALGYALGTLLKWGIDAGKWIAEAVPKLIQSIGDFFAKLPGKIAEWMTTVQTKLTTWGTNAMEWAKTAVSRLITSIVNFFAELPGKIAYWMTSTIDKVKQWGTDISKWAKTEIPKIVTSITDFFADLPKKMLDIGKNMITGLWDGIKSMTTWMKDKVSDFAGGVVGGIKDALGIHSPSRVMRDEVGKMIGSGMVDGIQASMNSVRSAMNDLVQIPTIEAPAASSNTSNVTINTSGMFAGASFQVRSDDDIASIANRVAQTIFDVSGIQTRSGGGMAPA